MSDYPKSAPMADGGEVNPDDEEICSHCGQAISSDVGGMDLDEDGSTEGPEPKERPSFVEALRSRR